MCEPGLFPTCAPHGPYMTPNISDSSTVGSDNTQVITNHCTAVDANHSAPYGAQCHLCAPCVPYAKQVVSTYSVTNIFEAISSVIAGDSDPVKGTNTIANDITNVLSDSSRASFGVKRSTWKTPKKEKQARVWTRM